LQEDGSLLTGSRLKDMIRAGARCLDNNKEAVNELNVFPVPDGDTGTNMCLTVTAAVREMDKVSSSSLGAVVKALSLGSLMGARGNSGVILSQLFRGLAKSLAERRSATPLQLAWAMHEGVDTAYKAVMKPVEGTILTVSREAARAALAAAKEGGDLETVLRSALESGRETLQRTPEMLPVLKEAGVVDAGGAGLIFVIEGVLQGLHGALEVPKNRAAPTASHAGDRAAAEPVSAAESPASDIEFAYDTQLLIRGSDLAVDRIRAELEPLGDSLLVVGDPCLVKVHVHTNEPDRAIGLCLGHGALVEATVENMREQHEAVKRSRTAAASPDEARAGVETGEGGQGGDRPAVAHPVVSLPESTEARPAHNGPGVVVVSSGDGLEEIFRNLGADTVISGGQTMNPSTEDILRAVEESPGQEVVILPNNGNIVLAAQQTAELTSKRVRVVPSKSIPQGIAALLAFNRSWDAERNGARMDKALGGVKSGEITYAVRDSKYNGIEIHEGDFIGLMDGEIVTVGSDSLSVLENLVARMADAETEVVTVFYGSDVAETDVADIRSHLVKTAPRHEIEVHRGGQPVYHYLVSVE